MIEATCSACGTLNRVSEANVPVGARFITCADCKSRIAIPAGAPPPPSKPPPPIPSIGKPGGLDLPDLPAPKRASARGPTPTAPRPVLPTVPSRPVPRGGLAAALDPELPAPKVTRAGGPPAAPTAISFDDPPPPPPGGGSEGVIDLPAPKRTAQRPPVIAAASDVIIDLPAPKIDRSVADLPAPKLGPRRGLADLPPPRDTAGGLAHLPAPRALGGAIIDLPAPKDTASGLAAVPPSPRDTASAPAAGLATPRAPQALMPQGPLIGDLPSPRAPLSASPHGPTIGDLPSPRAPQAPMPQGPLIGDLPSPRAPLSASPHGPTVGDLPSPRAPQAPMPQGPLIGDLPSPRASLSASPHGPTSSDPPPRAPQAPAPQNLSLHGPTSSDPPPPRAPQAPAPQNLSPHGPTSSDPPSPRAPQGASPHTPQGATLDDLSLPPRAQALPRTDLPAPKGFFDDLPQPVANQSDLPAPKGFFDDLPQPALRKPADLPAPKGFFDDLPQAKGASTGTAAGVTDLPAPKGFFDDLPQVKSHPSGSAPEVPAPKGYFDDIPGLPHTAKPEVPAPKGFFENIPGLPHTAKPEVPAPKGFFENIPGLPHTAKPEAPAPKGFFEGIPGLPHTTKPDVPAPQGHFDNVPGRPIKKPDELAPRGFFDDLPQRPAPRADGGPADLQLDARAELELGGPPRAASTFDDLELSRPAQPATSPVRFDPVSRPPDAEVRSPDAGPVRELEGPAPGTAARPVAHRPPKAGPAGQTGKDRAPRRRRTLLLGLLAVFILGGGGGFVLYRRHVAAVARDAAIAEQLAAARTAYAAGDPRHWQRAAAAARKVVELDEANPEALGIAAESLLASAIDDGTAATSKIAQAHAMLDTANSGGIARPELTRARALAALAAHQPDTALGQLEPLAAKAPQDPVLALYLGWALAAKGDAKAAMAAFDRASTGPATRLAALYGRGAARLELGELTAARADFTAVLELAKDHIGAQVGLAAALPLSAATRREAELLPILERKDIASADPRAVAMAWTLAGDAAMRAGRYDVARDRFRKALRVVPQDLAATTGLAATELRDNRIPAAAELTAGALGLAKDYVPAQLVQSAIEIRQHRLGLAKQRLAALAGRAVPLARFELARLQLVTGKLLEAEGKDDEAADAYVAAARTARELDLEPMLVAVGKLAAMTAAAVADHDQPRADALRARADELLGGLAEQARRDPQLALTLGIGYLQAGNADKAEPWLRQAAEARPRDAEARFQLGRALLRSGRPQDALEALGAAAGIDPARADIAAELARSYEVLGRDSDAAALYGKLLAAPDPSLELLARAGRFFARTGALDKAGELGKRILTSEPHHPAGLYLKGEGLLAQDKPAEAKQLFQRAVDADRDPQYLDALGRAAEVLAQGGDRDALEAALRAYQAAAEADPGMLQPRIGQGRLYIARHEAAKAVPPLQAASRISARNGEVLFLLGAAYQELQQPAEARRWLVEAAGIAPTPEAYWRLGQIEHDAPNRGPETVAALASATRLAAESENRTGKPIPWLTEALYLQGRVNLDLHHEAAARDAWMLYVARNPPPSAQRDDVTHQLKTTLR